MPSQRRLFSVPRRMRPRVAADSRSLRIEEQCPREVTSRGVEIAFVPIRDDAQVLAAVGARPPRIGVVPGRAERALEELLRAFPLATSL